MAIFEKQNETPNKRSTLNSSLIEDKHQIVTIPPSNQLYNPVEIESQKPRKNSQFHSSKASKIEHEDPNKKTKKERFQPKNTKKILCSFS